MANASAPDDIPNPPPQLPRPALMPAENRWADPFPSEPKAASPAPRPFTAPAAAETPPPAAITPPAPAKTAPPPPKAAPARKTAFKAPRVSPWVAAALGGVALVEAVVIVALLMRPPQTVAAAPAAGPPPTAAQTQPAAPVVQASVVAPPSTITPPQTPDPVQLAAGKQRSGGVRLITPIELKVLEGERVLGSTADGAIIATAGTHQLDLINTALGVRVRKAVTFRAGEIANFDVALPQGRVSVNAQPWAEVLIDNKPIGETPLANVAVPLGDHEVIFRHPDLGERRQTITVRADQPARVSQSFNR